MTRYRQSLQKHQGWGTGGWNFRSHSALGPKPNEQCTEALSSPFLLAHRQRLPQWIGGNNATNQVERPWAILHIALMLSMKPQRCPNGPFFIRASVISPWYWTYLNMDGYPLATQHGQDQNRKYSWANHGTLRYFPARIDTCWQLTKHGSLQWIALRENWNRKPL